MRQTISNNFHDTEIQINKTDDELEAIDYRIYQGTASPAEKAYQRRIWNTLCGISGCTCGDSFGRR